MAATLSTARLLLRPFGPDDAQALHAQWNDPDVRILNGRPARYHRLTVRDRAPR